MLSSSPKIPHWKTFPRTLSCRQSAQRCLRQPAGSECGKSQSRLGTLAMGPTAGFGDGSTHSRMGSFVSKWMKPRVHPTGISQIMCLQAQNKCSESPAQRWDSTSSPTRALSQFTIDIMKYICYFEHFSFGLASHSTDQQTWIQLTVSWSQPIFSCETRVSLWPLEK